MSNDHSSSVGLSRRGVLKGAVAGSTLLAAPSLMSPAFAQAGRPIKIGFISPKTGPLAAFGAADDFVLKEVRKALADGVTINGTKHPIQILERDSQSNPTRAAEVAAQLITAEKVSLMLASSTGDTTNPVGDQCEINGVPCITTDTPWEANFFGRGGDPKKGFDWTYHFFWGQQDVVNSFTSMWNSIETNKIVGGLWSNDSDGVAISDAKLGVPPAYVKAGFKYMDFGMFTPLSNDFSAQIAKLKAANVDIITGVFLPPDFATFWAQCAQQGYKPKIASIMKALLFPTAVEALGDRAIGLSTEVWWTPSHPFKSGLTGQTPAQLCEAYTKETGKQWTQPIGFKHAVVELAVDVLKRTKNINDPKSIRDAIATSDYQSIVGPINFSKGPLRNVSTTPLVGGQWQKGKDFKYDLAVVNNSNYPGIPTSRKFAPL